MNMRRLAFSGLLWAAAIVLTLVLAEFQRVTGPTYPKSGSLQMGSETIQYELLRTHDTGLDMPVRIEVGPPIQGSVVWRRFPTDEPWQTVPMEREGGELVSAIDFQPPAGKVEYQVVLESESGERHTIPDDEPAIARFKGAVPTAVLLPHVLAMFPQHVAGHSSPPRGPSA